MLLGLFVAAAGGLVAGSLLDLVVARLRAGGSPDAQTAVRRRRLVAALTALLFAAVVLAHGGDGAEIVLGLALAAFVVAAVLHELQAGALPDPVLAAVGATAVALGLLVDRSGEVERLLCALAAAGFVLLVALARPGITGTDGVKLAGLLGLLLGREVAVAVLIAVAAHVVLMVVAAARSESPGAPRSGARGRALLLLGAAGALIVGEPLVDAYLGAL